MGNKLLKSNDGMLSFYCKGCNCHHGVYTNRSKGVNWEFNGDYNNPTFNPSIKVTMGHYPDPNDICHFFIINGKIQYLNDCTHELAGKTIEMQDED